MKKQYISSTLLLAAFLSVPFSMAQQPQGGLSSHAKNNDQVYRVRTGTPSRMTIADNINRTGTLASPAVVDIQPKISGRLISVNDAHGNEITEGTSVSMGLVIAQIDKQDYSAQLDLAEARLASARATLKQAESDFKRMEVLIKSETVTEQELDHAQAEFERAKASVSEATANQFIATVNLAETEIKAPFNGTIFEKYAHTGTMLSPTTKIYQIAQTDTLDLFFDLPTTLFARVKPGVTLVTIEFDAYPGETITLPIHAVRPSANSNTRTVRIELHVPNADGKYLPGMFAKGTVALDQRENTLVVPYEAVVRADDMNLVYTIKDGKAVSTPVKLGSRFNQFFEILDGITDSDTIITVGLHRLTDGANVSVENK